MQENWIKLHRQIRDNPFYTNPTASSVWIECLLRACYKDNDFFLRRQKVKIEVGQFAMGREEFGRSIGVSGSTAWYWLLQFEADSMIDIKKSNKGSIVTVNNWSRYQVSDNKADNPCTTDEQQMNTIKKVKKEKKVKNYSEVEKEIIKWLTRQGKDNPEGYLVWLQREWSDVLPKAWKKANSSSVADSPAKLVELCKYLSNVPTKK